jgi:hypothetical protein
MFKSRNAGILCAVVLTVFVSGCKSMQPRPGRPGVSETKVTPPKPNEVVRKVNPNVREGLQSGIDRSRDANANQNLFDDRFQDQLGGGQQLDNLDEANQFAFDNGANVNGINNTGLNGVSNLVGTAVDANGNVAAPVFTGIFDGNNNNAALGVANQALSQGVQPGCANGSCPSARRPAGGQATHLR